MMFLRNALFIVALFIFGSNLYAQTTTQPDLNKSLIPPSPEAASLGKFGILPVTLYEGMPNRNVPIYEVKVGKLNLPISLNYNYNGYWKFQSPSPLKITFASPHKNKFEILLYSVFQ